MFWNERRYTGIELNIIGLYMSLTIAVICGSVRKNRKSIYPARYVYQKIKDAGHESTLVDFDELPLPFVYTDPNPSKLNKQYPDENVRTWSSIVDAADGLIIVTPEYNHGYPGVLKNALDWLYPEFNNKPVGLVGVSDGVNGGIRAIEALRPVMANFGMYDIQQTVAVRSVQNVFDADGQLVDIKLEAQIDKLVNVLVKTADVMKALRA